MDNERLLQYPAHRVARIQRFERILKNDLHLAPQRAQFGAAQMRDVAPLEEDRAGRRFEQPQQSFADVLDGLRTEEDSFSFVIAGGPQNGQRVLLTRSQMVIGWDDLRQQLAFEEENVATPWVLIRKDWSGVAATATNPGSVVIKGEKRGAAYRLHHNDEIELGTFCWEEIVPRPKKSSASVTKEEVVRLIFQEPLALAQLQAILPEGLPQPVTFAPHTNELSNDLSGAGQLFAVPADTLKVKSRTNTSTTSTPRRYFGHFTVRELLGMALGTAVLTLLLFVVLNLL